MKAQMLTGIQRMETGQVDDPAITRPNEVLLRIETVGVCGSDVHYYETGRIGSQVVEFPYIVGHECTAVVAEVGAEVQTLKVGDPVVVDPLIHCGQCDQCRAGRINTCRNQKFLGCPGQVQGCLCEYIVMPAECCFPTHGRITAEQGVLCEPLAIGIYAAAQADLRPGAKIGILGAGPIGLCVLEAAKAEGIHAIYVTEKIPERMETAKNAGAVWAGSPTQQDIVTEILKQQPMGLDAVFECAGQQETLDQGIELLRPGGKLMMVGIPREDRVSFMPDRMRRKELSLINVRRQNHCTQKAIDLVAEGKISVDYMVTHRFNLADTAAAFDLVANYKKGVIKALIGL